MGLASSQRVVPVGIAVAMLLGISWERAAYRLPKGDAAPYHAAVRGAAAQIPYYIGEWVGIDETVPPAAVTMLRPNAIVCRSYHNIRTGRRVTFLLVQCGDARDLLGHYPPVCYVAHGWTQTRAEARDWTLGRRSIRGMEYEFIREAISTSDAIVIYNFMITPDGQTARDMQRVNIAAQDYRRKSYGAAQLQLIFNDGMSVEERDLIFRQLVGANVGVLQVIEAP